MLAVCVSLVEALGALLLFSILAAITTPSGRLELPLVGDLHERFPQVPSGDLFRMVAVAVAVFFLVRGGLQLLQVYLQNRMAHSAGSRLAQRLFRTYLHRSYAWHLQRNSSDLIRNAIDSVLSIVTYVLVPLVGLISESLVVLAMIAVLLITAPKVTAVLLLVTGPLVFLLVKSMRSQMTNLGAEAQAMYASLLHSMQQGLQGLREVKLLNREDYFEKRFKEAREGLSRSKYLGSTYVELPRAVVETMLITGFLIFLATRVNTGGRVGGSLAVLGLLAYSVLRVLPALNRCMAHLSNLRFGRAAIDQVDLDLRAPDPFPPLPPKKDRLRLRDELRCDDLSFAYPGGAVAVNTMSLSISAGSSIGVIGPTGGGKTTLIDLLTGLLEPDEGRIVVDGVDIHDDVRAWQGSVGVVPQTVFLLDDTVRRNVAFGLEDSEIQDARIWEALRLAQLDEFVRELKSGLDTPVGERGVRMSGGQRQRVAIARALFNDPDVLILDEGTASLDSLTEAAIVQALDYLRGNKTIIAVAHRLSTVRSCDRIFLVAGGEIQDFGKFDELFERNEHFRAIATASEPH